MHGVGALFYERRLGWKVGSPREEEADRFGGVHPRLKLPFLGRRGLFNLEL